MRISKAPQERKQEILDTAMKLFYEQGYEQTTMADIAKEMNVVKGLCYRYFDSKQKLFEAAMDQYVELCCKDFIQLIKDDSLSLKELMESMINRILQENDYACYHDFFHQSGNEDMHEQLTIKMCKYIHPYLDELFLKLAKEKGISPKKAKTLIRFILYGQIGLLSSCEEPIEETISEIQVYIILLLKEYQFI